MKKVIFIVLVLLETLVSAQNKSAIDSVLTAFLNNSILYDAHVGIQLYDIQTRNNLLDYNSQKLFVPASIQKLFTTATSLELLSNDFRFTTKVLYSGELDINSGIINGNLYVVCSGDPSLESVYFSDYSFLKSLNAILIEEGVKKISGRLFLLDNKGSYSVNSNWLWGDIGNYYGAGVSSISFRDNTIEVYFNSSDTVGGPTTISKIIPENNQVTIVNKVVSGESNRDLAYGYGAPYDSVRTIVGEIPRSKKNFKVKISMHDPSCYLKNEIEQLLNFEHQNINSIDRLDTLLIYKSPSLLNLLENVNTKSNNNYTEHILLKSMCLMDSSLSIESAPFLMNDYWTNQLQLKHVFYTVDASGLSRKNLISPGIMNKLLIYIFNNNTLKSTFLSTLPKAGVSGTLKYLGIGSSIENHFIGKSGSMDGIRCYAGYFIKNESYYPFTIMLNNFSSTSKKVKEAIVDLMEGIYQNL